MKTNPPHMFGNDPQRFARDPAVTLPDGTALRLPRPFNVHEAALPGNARAFPGGVVLLYDGDSKTLAAWQAIPAPGMWRMFQPVERSVFEHSIGDLEKIEAAAVAARDAGDAGGRSVQ